MTRRRPLIADHRTAVLVAGGLWAAGLYLMVDAWDGHGRKRPGWLGFLTPL